MVEIAIGKWVRRERPEAKWHVVESVIAGDAITHCGRRMADPGLEVSEVEPLTRLIGQPQNCKRCSR
jgi:hypothetical protein